MQYWTTNSQYGNHNQFQSSITTRNSSIFPSNLTLNTTTSHFTPPLARGQSFTSTIPNQFQRQLSKIQDDKPLGLTNLRNTCYMNAILQILFQILQLPLNLQTGPVTRGFLRLKDSHSTSDISAFKQEAEKRLDFMRGFTQQDAQQFLRSLLQIMNQQNSQILVKNSKPFGFVVNPKLKVVDNWRYYVQELSKYDSSQIINLFAGESVTDIRCQSNHLRYTFDRFMDLSLSFPSVDRTYSIVDMMKWEFQTERLDGIECEACKARVTSFKTNFLYNLPAFLVIHINRFWQGRTSNSKINTPVEFNQTMELPMQVLHQDIRHTKPTYQLVGVVNHLGTIDTGHYYCEVKGQNGLKWYQCNDDIVNQVSMPKTTTSQNVYMLFYQRIS